ncbi:uncharacterized protein LOC106153728 isoform X2 [Lingula anatina]|uniref:Uncharacterized protein LOC106153728 isoform X2 n=1 Tax=Lingula anatina TaxID=7574 RepID=A0A1S3HB22_LINAN|nr:uncharacterized protein LOC106153728 isoform X2 [Lingula anatina]|eukprot:XP_013383255.1 uncharacterized protein LOC106153728 isoform X2 [Lingula anatina]
MGRANKSGGHSTTCSDNDGGSSGSSDLETSSTPKKLQLAAKKKVNQEKKREKELHMKTVQHKLCKADFLSKSTEFRTWLKEEKKKQFEELSATKAKEMFKKFVKKWNKKTLPKKYYRGISSMNDTDSPSVTPDINKSLWSLADMDNVSMLSLSSIPDDDQGISTKSPDPDAISVSSFGTFGKRQTLIDFSGSDDDLGNTSTSSIDSAFEFIKDNQPSDFGHTPPASPFPTIRRAGTLSRTPKGLSALRQVTVPQPPRRPPIFLPTSTEQPPEAVEDETTPASRHNNLHVEIGSGSPLDNTKSSGNGGSTDSPTISLEDNALKDTLNVLDDVICGHEQSLDGSVIEDGDFETVSSAERNRSTKRVRPLHFDRGTEDIFPARIGSQIPPSMTSSRWSMVSNFFNDSESLEIVPINLTDSSLEQTDHGSHNRSLDIGISHEQQLCKADSVSLCEGSVTRRDKVMSSFSDTAVYTEGLSRPLSTFSTFGGSSISMISDISVGSRYSMSCADSTVYSDIESNGNGKYHENTPDVIEKQSNHAHELEKNEKSSESINITGHSSTFQTSKRSSWSSPSTKDTSNSMSFASPSTVRRYGSLPRPPATLRAVAIPKPPVMPKPSIVPKENGHQNTVSTATSQPTISQEKVLLLNDAKSSQPCNKLEKTPPNGCDTIYPVSTEGNICQSEIPLVSCDNVNMVLSKTANSHFVDAVTTEPLQCSISQDTMPVPHCDTVSIVSLQPSTSHDVAPPPPYDSTNQDTAPVPPNNTDSTLPLQSSTSQDAAPVPPYDTVSIVSLQSSTSQDAAPVPPYDTVSIVSLQSSTNQDAAPVPSNNTVSTLSLQPSTSQDAAPVPSYDTVNLMSFQSSTRQDTAVVPHLMVSTESIKSSVFQDQIPFLQSDTLSDISSQPSASQGKALTLHCNIVTREPWQSNGSHQGTTSLHACDQLSDNTKSYNNRIQQKVQEKVPSYENNWKAADLTPMISTNDCSPTDHLSCEAHIKDVDVQRRRIPNALLPLTANHVSKTTFLSQDKNSSEITMADTQPTQSIKNETDKPVDTVTSKRRSPGKREWSSDNENAENIHPEKLCKSSIPNDFKKSRVDQQEQCAVENKCKNSQLNDVQESLAQGKMTVVFKPAGRSTLV